MTTGLMYLLGVGTWIGALILAGIIVNVYFFTKRNNQHRLSAVKENIQRRNR